MLEVYYLASVSYIPSILCAYCRDGSKIVTKSMYWLTSVFRIGPTAFNNWHEGCSGKRQCTVPGAQADVINKNKCGEYYLEDYGTVTQYMYIDYYCIESKCFTIKQHLFLFCKIKCTFTLE